MKKTKLFSLLACVLAAVMLFSACGTVTSGETPKTDEPAAPAPAKVPGT